MKKQSKPATFNSLLNEEATDLIKEYLLPKLFERIKKAKGISVEIKTEYVEIPPKMELARTDVTSFTFIIKEEGQPKSKVEA